MSELLLKLFHWIYFTNFIRVNFDLYVETCMGNISEIWNFWHYVNGLVYVSLDNYYEKCNKFGYKNQYRPNCFAFSSSTEKKIDDNRDDVSHVPLDDRLFLSLAK